MVANSFMNFNHTCKQTFTSTRLRQSMITGWEQPSNIIPLLWPTCHVQIHSKKLVHSVYPLIHYRLRTWKVGKVPLWRQKAEATPTVKFFPPANTEVWRLHNMNVEEKYLLKIIIYTILVFNDLVYPLLFYPGCNNKFYYPSKILKCLNYKQLKIVLYTS